METLTIQKMRIQNFKGIKDFTFESNGQSIAVFGDNASGKTTLADAFFYLTFGKNSEDKADFGIKPLTEDGKEIHNLETEVEAHLEYNNKPIVLLKRYKEKYTQKRGSAQSDFTGHTTDYFIDEVPVKKKDFDVKIGEIVDINAFKLVTNPNEFANLHWTGRRAILMEMCGGVSDEDVIKSDKNLAGLTTIIGDHSIDDYKKIISSKQSKINAEKKQIPARISENLEASKNAEKPEQKEKDVFDKALADAQGTLQSLQSNEALSEKRVRLNEVNGEIQKAKNEADKKQTEGREPIQKTIDQLTIERRGNVNKVSELQDQVTKDENRNRISGESVDAVRKQWYEEDAKKPQDKTICPTCSQDLPEDQINTAIEKFNKTKADTLEKITQEGVSLNEAIETREKAISLANISIDNIDKIIAGIDQELKIKNADLKKVYVPVKVDALDKEKDVLESEISALENGSKTQENTAKRHIEEAQAKVAEWNKAQAIYEAAEKNRARIEKLETQEKTLAKEFERLESELFLIEQFIVAKVELLEDQINNRFKMARFKLFETQINGGINECCEILYNGIPFDKGLNNAARINVGLDIVNTLSDYYGFSAPVFIDNRESVNELIPINSQVISLIVSKDKKLIVMGTEALQAS